MRNTIIIAVGMSVLGLVSAKPVFAQSCCPGGTMTGHCGSPAASVGETHGNHADAQAATEEQNTAPKAALPKPVQTVFDDYLNVQRALAEDSTSGLRRSANVLVTATRSATNLVSPKIAQQAEALAKASDLASARASFKALSDALIGYLKEQKVPAGVYHEVYCPMAKASWLQTDKTVANPYMGKAMLRCGEFQS